MRKLKKKNRFDKAHDFKTMNLYRYAVPTYVYSNFELISNCGKKTTKMHLKHLPRINTSEKNYHPFTS